jgi:DNA-binding protein HU-beta
MTKADVVDYMADRMGMTKKSVKEFFDEFAELAYKEAENGFTVPGIGKIKVVNRKAREGRNPQTGETIHIPARRALKFRFSKAAKDGALD